MKLPISAVILTYNEEKNIEICLKSICEWISEIFIVDSGSTDKTIEIAKKYTDKIYYHSFEIHAKQWNWAFKNLPLAY
jgi:glycosyltransferase involved in cell wall biosynthesis